MSTRALIKLFTFLTGRLLERGACWREALISKFSKIGIQIFYMRLEIKYHPTIFEKYIIFNIDEHLFSLDEHI